MADSQRFTTRDAELCRGMAEYIVTRSYARLDAIGVRVWNTQPYEALQALAEKIEAHLRVEAPHG
jgi:hypothetical protein